MPLFDFKCHTCDARWTDVQISNWHSATNTPYLCPGCHATLEKLPAAPNFVLKGSGFHVNDYPSKPKS